MPNPDKVSSFTELAKLADYSFLDNLTPDPDATESGEDYYPRQVFSGHYVPVKPTPLAQPEYIAHSHTLFDELGFADSLATTDGFTRLFSGDVSASPEPMRKLGWATGYALSIYGTEYTQQCPFRTGNAYGDGRAISVLELVAKDKRWEMQLKGAGQTPYCRGGDGRAVLRSSVREFLAQEHMHALGIATSRSLSLFVSKTETVDRPWYYEGSRSQDPEIMVSNPVAISTRVAPSFLRVGQIELFARRARVNEHDNAMAELTQIVQHLIEREYPNDVDQNLVFTEQVLQLASAFRDRLTTLVTHWLRVGFCQGNFNSDNCAAGGYTLDYGPFGFSELFDPVFQPWTGGGQHFSFLNQPMAAQKNFEMFCRSLKVLLQDDDLATSKLEAIEEGFSALMEAKLDKMWAAKLGLDEYDSALFVELLQLMVQSGVDYNMLFRELSAIPEDMTQLTKCFYKKTSQEQDDMWSGWLAKWRNKIGVDANPANAKVISKQMKQVNPKFTWREWLVVPAYQSAAKGDYSLINELQAMLTQPYEEQSSEVTDKFYRLRPVEYFGVGGINHYSCSS
ncbi:YdiU family protein [Catenovulum sp. SM1970]|uniref:protein adenylyltransferase SelO n=1 Tax=Marinifaba aquimaris TaxID=2741323 RepID=UPI0015746E2E|nr:protein adenylyltransferase SelO family protein [Marinifaba aquimaris]NTS77118.1 YdiU family protein [Marinifaba aquimaris]